MYNNFLKISAYNLFPLHAAEAIIRQVQDNIIKCFEIKLSMGCLITAVFSRRR